ncbi:hypothetical protein CPC08DRAFT_338626 [Agrocybe pediades]|nr:hypothetical protein CPC08DRAFT_338626 [Agrocybe pediades]
MEMCEELYTPGSVSKVEDFDAQAGKFFYHTINHANPAEVGLLAEDAHRAIAADDERVHRLWEDGEGARLRAEERTRVLEERTRFWEEMFAQRSIGQ